MNDDKREIRKPPPMNDAEFDAWWRSFDDTDLDEFEREIEESIKDYEIPPDADREEKKRRIQEMARCARGSAYPAGLTEEQQRKFPPRPARLLARRGGNPLRRPNRLARIRQNLHIPRRPASTGAHRRTFRRLPKPTRYRRNRRR